MFKTISEIKDRNAEIGNHWFERGTMKFFRSRIAPGIYPLPDGALFITSEQFDENSPRKYTIRHAYENGHIDTVGKFQAYGFLEDARDAAKEMAQEIRARRQNSAGKRSQSRVGKHKGATASRSIVKRNPSGRHYEYKQWLDFLCDSGTPTAALRKQAANFEQAVASFMSKHQDNEVANRLAKAQAAYLTYSSIVGAGTGLWDEEPDGDALDKLVEQDASLVRMAQRLDEDIDDCRGNRENPAMSVPVKAAIGVGILAAVGGAAWYLTREKKGA
jgi:hypothetical protein